MNRPIHQLMLHHGFGDFLMAVPVIKSLRRVDGGTLDIVVKNSAIADFGRRVLSEEGARWHLKPSRPGGWLSLVRRLRARAPKSFLAVHAKSRLVGGVAWASGAPIRVGPVARYGYNRAALSGHEAFGKESVYDERRHKVQTYLDFVRAMGFEVDEEEADVTLDAPTDARESIARRFPFLTEKVTVGIAPSCGLGQHKRWSEERYASVVRSLAKECPDLHFALLGHERDQAIGDAILAGLPNGLREARMHDLVGETDLVDLLAVTEQLSLLLAVCNGPSHVAAAADVPVVGIYGPTNPGFTGPYTDQLYVVRKGYGCSPCYRTEFNQGCGNPRCMSDIQVDEVVSACRSALEGVAPDPVPKLDNSQAWTFSR